MITFNEPIYCVRQQQTAIARFEFIREAILPIWLPKQSLIVPHYFSREQGGRKPVNHPHIWIQATVLKVIGSMWPIDFLENYQVSRFFNRDVESLLMRRFIDAFDVRPLT